MNNEPDYDNLYFEEKKMTMQDRLRFRAWYKDYYIYDIQLVGADWSVSKQCNEDCFGDFFYNEYCVIEQCTGLKDKNGKLIYEGDIVEYYNEKIHQNFREEVLPFRELRTKGIMRHLIDERNAYKLEVIGNIHEESELLELKNVSIRLK